MFLGEYRTTYYLQKPLYAYAAGDVLYPGVIVDHYQHSVWLEPNRTRFCPHDQELGDKDRCGIWAFRDVSDLANIERGLMLAMVLEFSGLVSEYELGYIGSEAVISKIVIASPRFQNIFSGPSREWFDRRFKEDVTIVDDINFWSRFKPQREPTEAELFEEWKKERRTEKK